MKKQLRRIIIMVALIFLTIQPIDPTMAKEKPSILNGRLDLRDLSITDIGPIDLDGEWEFYWGELLLPEEVADYTAQIVDAPDDWNNYAFDGGVLDRYGYATYSITIYLDEADIGDVYSLYMRGVSTAYDLWINQELVASIGRVAKNRAESTPGNLPQLVTFQTDRSEVELLLHVSNFHQRKSGLWETISFGTTEQISSQRDLNLISQLFVIGSIFMMALYHLVLFFYRRKHRSALYFAITCFGVGLRTLFLRENLFAYLLTGEYWEVAVSIEYISVLVALLFFLLFVKRGLSLKIPNKLSHFFVIALSTYSLFVLITPARIFTNTFVVLQLLVSIIMVTIVLFSIKAAIKKQEGGIINIIAVIVLFMAIVNDLFYYSNWISTDEFVSFGLVFYFFIQSIHLARRFSRSFDEVEKLSGELKTLNQSLEAKVNHRTIELQAANTNLKKMEEARRRLFANVSHELNTPLTFIQGNIKAMMDGLIPKDESKYYRSVYEDTRMMAHMINDLQMLSKFDYGQIDFSFERVEARDYFSSLIETEQSFFQKKELSLEYEEHLPPEIESIFCEIDPIRIKQIVMNLLVNAEKHTPAGGRIILKLGANQKLDQLKVSVSDTGIGIEERDLSYVFERFYKANNTRDISKKGGGLGLSIVKEFIEAHGGMVGVSSRFGEGTTFYFTLPIRQMSGEEL